MIDPKFWHKKRVLVTGHTGFKGSWLCLWLAKMGAKVTGVALPPLTRPSLFKVAMVGDVLEDSIMLDIRDRKALGELFHRLKPEIVIHMAAQPLVLESYKDPVGTYETNVLGTVNLLEAIRTISGVCAVLNVTTDKCYENFEHLKGYRESDALGGYDPYSSSKACSEIVTGAYRRSFFSEHKKRGTAIATARSGNVFGGGDWSSDRLVPDCVRACMKGKDIVLRSPEAVRPWLHILDPLCGYIMLAEQMFRKGQRFSSAWNFGPDAKGVFSARQIALQIAGAWGGKTKIKISSERHPHEAGLLILNTAKVKKELGWRPRLSMARSVHLTVDWYKQWNAGEDMQEVSLRQITYYEGMVRS